ncbi:hypothetical protein OROHE_013648 [Orobanche hederae]
MSVSNLEKLTYFWADIIKNLDCQISGTYFTLVSGQPDVYQLNLSNLVNLEEQLQDALAQTRSKKTLNLPHLEFQYEGCNKLVIDVGKHFLVKIGPFSPEKVRILMKKYENRLIPSLKKWGEDEKVEKYYNKIGESTDFFVENLERIDVYMQLSAVNSNYSGKGSPIFAYYKNGCSAPPTLMYMAYGLKVVEYIKCEYRLRMNHHHHHQIRTRMMRIPRKEKIKVLY